ncbi:MAG: ABC-2 type transport system ATP-binding protein [Paraglaciecola sp.]|jgi:ABC-2 type transport system ATP-binding protein
MAAVGNRVMIIAKGKLLFDGSPKALSQKYKYYGAVTLYFSYRADDSELGELEGVAEIEEDLATGRVTLFPKPVSDILHLVTTHAQRANFH